MPRYFFHVHSSKTETDKDGHEYANDLIAQKEAAKYFGALVSENPSDLWQASGLEITVSDKSGVVLFSVSLSGYAATRTSKPLADVTP